MQHAPGRCDCAPDAPDPVFDPTASADICRSCGVVIETVLYDGRDWSFDDDPRGGGARVGLPGEDAGIALDFGRAVSKTTKMVLSQTSNRISDSDRLVDRTCAQLNVNVPSVIHSIAREVFHRHAEGKILSGDTRRGTAAACVFFACRLERADRELSVVSRACEIDIKSLTACVKAVKDTVVSIPAFKDGASVVGVNTLFSRYVNRLDAPPEVRRRVWGACNALYDKLAPRLLSTTSKPRTIVAGVMVLSVHYTQCGLEKQHVMRATGVCAQTIDTFLGDIPRSQ